MLGPTYLILDLADAVKAYKTEIASLPVDQEELNINLVLTAFIEFACEKKGTMGYVSEFIRTVCEILEPQVSFTVLEDVEAALTALGKALVKELHEKAMFHPDGGLWYVFDHLCGNSPVLRKMQREDYIN